MQRKGFLLLAAASTVGFGFFSLCVAAPEAGKKVVDIPTGIPVQTTVPNTDLAEQPAGANTFLGTYVGQFGKHRITVCLQNVLERSINGYSVVAGNVRAFSGSLVENPRAFEMLVREPGDDKNDGTFRFVFHPDTRHLVGTWTPNDVHLTKIDFDLPRKNFQYDPKLGRYPQASTRPLKTADVENMLPAQLRIMRNEIYARHGYTFRLADMRDYFDQQDWYVPISMNVSTQLTSVETKNAELIKHYEDYGNEQYDAFGR